MSCLITFGQSHVHKIGGTTLDRNVVARVRDRDHAFALFGPVWAFEYREGELSPEKIAQFFPRGIVDLTEAEPPPPVEAPAFTVETVTRTAYICPACEGVYMDVATSQCDCLNNPGNEFITAQLVYDIRRAINCKKD